MLVKKNARVAFQRGLAYFVIQVIFQLILQEGDPLLEGQNSIGQRIDLRCQVADNGFQLNLSVLSLHTNGYVN